jgi:hypothetical protein
MNVLIPGHRYELANHEKNIAELNQRLQFIQKEPDTESGLAGALKTVHDGTTNEEVLAVLIDRMNSLQAKFPCRENAIVTTKLEECLMWLEKRTATRKARNVEGRHLA